MNGLVPPQRVLSPRRWREYIYAIYPGLRLTRSKTDLCDRCVRIEIELTSPDLTENRRQILEEERKVHLEDAIAQRKVWSNFIKDYVHKTDPNLILSDSSFPVMIEEVKESNIKKRQNEEKQVEEDAEKDDKEESGEHGPAKQDLGLVMIQAEDYGGGIALPHYG